MPSAEHAEAAARLVEIQDEQIGDEARRGVTRRRPRRRFAR